MKRIKATHIQCYYAVPIGNLTAVSKYDYCVLPPTLRGEGKYNETGHLNNYFKYRDTVDIYCCNTTHPYCI